MPPTPAVQATACGHDTRRQALLGAGRTAARRLADDLYRRAARAWRCLYFGRHLDNVPPGSLVIFPCRPATLHCGIAGIVAFRRAGAEPAPPDTQRIEKGVARCETDAFRACTRRGLSIDEHYLGGPDAVASLQQDVLALKTDASFRRLLDDGEHLTRLEAVAERLDALATAETQLLGEQMGRLDTATVSALDRRLETLKDIAWCLRAEVLGNVRKTRALLPRTGAVPDSAALGLYRRLNAVLNSLDRLEVRGRDSAGISVLFVFAADVYARFAADVDAADLTPALSERTTGEVLVNGAIRMHRADATAGSGSVGLAFTYKVAAEIGSLGDNIAFLRAQIADDRLLHLAAALPYDNHTISSHTRWASVGAITEPNCHPVDNLASGDASRNKGIIHACLNGDIDNYLQLRKAFEADGTLVPEDITTDTKIIPLQIEKYVRAGEALEEAFRLALNDFEGSHAIAMHSDLAPGKFFLAQRGSGQAVFVGIADGLYMPTSEVYGFIEETSRYIKMNGETQGQIFVLDQNSAGGPEAIRAMSYDGTPIALGPADVKRTAITSRDIDRQDFAHYFLKEISESPNSVARTLQNRWKTDPDSGRQKVHLDSKAFPPSLVEALRGDRIRRIFFMGQGTAGIAAQACADILDAYLGDPAVQIRALKASELSGFQLNANDAADCMADTLVVAISQSGTTTDTNRTVDMVKLRGARTLAVVNRRDSDITFKVDGVIYTSSGRDIEMSVASTKAFYSQIVAGALLALKIAEVRGRRSAAFISGEIGALLEIPAHMRTVLAMKGAIATSAQRLAATKTYWAAVGSGPNKAAADEIRIKLSELCYKTISSDFVEDKKHIDLSSEPLIIVCAAGSHGTVIGDIIKDTAIFAAHKATPVVIADDGESRFDPYAVDVFHVPAVSSHLAPILNTLVGHIWGYYAALSINEGSRFLHTFRQDLRQTVRTHAQKGLDIYETILEESFREKIARFYSAFRKKKNEQRLPTAIAFASDLTLLLKYLAGRLPVADFEIDFARKGTAKNMLETLFEYLGRSINSMARPVDAIKHQAKTVTVGTSRISDTLEGLLFEALAANAFDASHLINRNVIVLKNLQAVVSHIEGSILYRLDKLNLLGELTPETTIEVLNKTGILATMPSRVERDTQLKGTKKIIVRQGNVYIGKGRKDNRSIIIIPIISGSAGSPNITDHLLLLNIAFRQQVPLADKVKALGGKYEHIKNIVQENSVKWEDAHLERVPIDELFGRSAEKIGELIVQQAG